MNWNQVADNLKQGWGRWEQWLQKTEPDLVLGGLAVVGLFAFAVGPITWPIAGAVLGPLGQNVAYNMFANGVSTLYKKLANQGGTVTSEQLAQAIQDEAALNEQFRVELYHFSVDVLEKNQRLFQEMQETHDSTVDFGDHILEAIKYLGSANSEQAVALQEFAQSLHRKMDQALSGISDIKQLLMLGTPSAVDQAALTTCYQQYLEYVIREHATIHNIGILQTHRQTKLDTEKVYVGLSAVYNHRFVQLSLFDFAPDNGMIKLDDLVRSVNCIVLLGEPGSGKTTLLRYLTLRHARALDAGQTVVDGYGPAKLPIYVPVRSYANARKRNRNLALSAYLSTYYKENGIGALVSNLFAAALSHRQALILLDGLDEIDDPTTRLDISRQVDRLVNDSGIGFSKRNLTTSRRDNHFIVTSRVVGYNDAPLMSDAWECTIQPMQDDEIKQFVTFWCNEVERRAPVPNPDLAAEQIEGILSAVRANVGVRLLATNPLLLTILALIYHNGTRLPNRRVDLYHMAADTLARDWELARGANQEELISETEIADVLGPLAYCLHTDLPNGSVAKKHAFRYLSAALAERRELDVNSPKDQNELRAAVDDFLYRVELHTGLFYLRGYDADHQSLYGFMHQSFEEYYVARYLANHYVDQPTLLATLRSHLHKSVWQEPILLTLGYIAFVLRLDQHAGRILAELCLSLDPERQSAYEDFLHRDLLFAWRIWAEGIKPPRADLERMINTTFDLYVTEYTPTGDRMTPLGQAISEAWKKLAGSKDAEAVAQQLADRLGDADSSTKRVMAEVFGILEVKSEAVMAVLEQLASDLDPEVQAAALSTWLGFGDQDLLDRVQNELDKGSLDARVHRAAARAMLDRGQIHKSQVKEWLKILANDYQGMVEVAHSSLETMDDTQTSAALHELLADSDQHICFAAADILSRSGQHLDEVAALLNQQLTSNNLDKQASAAIRLAEQGDKSGAVVSILQTMLTDGRPHFRLAAALALFKLELTSEQMWIVLVDTLTVDDHRLFRILNGRLPHLLKAHPALATMIVSRLVGADERDNSAFISLLGPQRNNAALATALQPVLVSQSEQNRYRAALLLQQMDYKEEDLTTAWQSLLNSDIQTAQGATYYLTQLGRADVLNDEQLQRLLTDDDILPRLSAVAALIQRQQIDNKVLAVIDDAMADGRVAVRAKAVQLLRKLPKGFEAYILGQLPNALLVMTTEVTIKVIELVERLAALEPTAVKEMLYAMKSAKSHVQPDDNWLAQPCERAYQELLKLEAAYPTVSLQQSNIAAIICADEATLSTLERYAVGKTYPLIDAVFAPVA